MNLRHELKKTHKWSGPQEEEVSVDSSHSISYIQILQESNAKLREMMRFVWRRIDPAKRMMVGRPVGGRGSGGGRFNYRGQGGRGNRT